MCRCSVKTAMSEEWFEIGISFVCWRFVDSGLMGGASGPHCDAAVLGSSWGRGRKIR